jgi:hypothetical protein
MKNTIFIGVIVLLLFMQFVSVCHTQSIEVNEGGAVLEFRQCKSPLQALVFGI